jgi:hypothetical protein
MSVDTVGVAANAGDGAKAANNAASAWRRFMGIPLSGWWRDPT